MTRFRGGLSAEAEQFFAPFQDPSTGAYVDNDGRIRDYGAFVPLNLQMQLNVASQQLKLADNSGRAVAAQALSFQAADLPSAPAQAGTSKFRSAFFAPNATVIHVYVIGVH